MTKYKKCKCPIGIIISDCPFSYANGWHNQRDAILLQTDVSSIAKKIDKMSDKQIERRRNNVDLLDDSE